MPRREKADAASQAFGVHVRRVREEKGLTIEEVAGRISTRSRRNGKPVPMDAKSLGEVERGWYSLPDHRTGQEDRRSAGRVARDSRSGSLTILFFSRKLREFLIPWSRTGCSSPPRCAGFSPSPEPGSTRQPPTGESRRFGSVDPKVRCASCARTSSNGYRKHARGVDPRPEQIRLGVLTPAQES